MSKQKILLKTIFTIALILFTNNIQAKILTEEFNYTAGQTLTANRGTAYSGSDSDTLLVSSDNPNPIATLNNLFLITPNRGEADIV